MKVHLFWLFRCRAIHTCRSVAFLTYENIPLFRTAKSMTRGRTSGNENNCNPQFENLSPDHVRLSCSLQCTVQIHLELFWLLFLPAHIIITHSFEWSVGGHVANFTDTQSWSPKCSTCHMMILKLSFLVLEGLKFHSDTYITRQSC